MQALRAAATRLSAVTVTLAVMFCLLVLSGLRKRLSNDEPYNLGYGYAFMATGPSAHTRSQRMPVLALNALSCYGSGCSQPAVDASEWNRFLVRVPSMAFALLLALAIHRWARELYSAEAALLALVLLAANPDFLAHGKQVTSDVSASFFALAAVFAFWRFMRDPRLSRLALWSALSAGAVASKYTNLLLLPYFAGVFAFERFASREGTLRERCLKFAAAGLAYAFGFLLVLNAFYLFDGTFRPVRDLRFKSQVLAPLKAWPVRLPLPSAFALGLDRSMLLQEESALGPTRGMNYALGRADWGRIPYAFPLMLLLKTPLALFGLLAIAAAARPSQGRVREEILYLWIPFLLIFLFYTFLVVPQLGVRYLLPSLPFLLVFAGRSLAAPVPRRRGLVLGALTVWYVVSSLSYHPHYMSYFNELIGPRVDAYRYLADSNLDWEDRSYFLAQFQKEHPEIPFFYEPETPRTGWIVVRANSLIGILGDRERYRWLRRNFRPVRHIAYSYLLFFVPPDPDGP